MHSHSYLLLDNSRSNFIGCPEGTSFVQVEREVLRSVMALVLVGSGLDWRRRPLKEVIVLGWNETEITTNKHSLTCTW